MSYPESISPVSLRTSNLKEKSFDFSRRSYHTQIKEIPTMKNLTEKISELELTQKLLVDKVEELKTQNENLRKELKRVKNFSKRLLSKKLMENSAKTLSLVQELYEGGNEIELQFYKSEFDNLKKTYERSLEENSKLEEIIKRYRKHLRSSLDEKKFPDSQRETSFLQEKTISINLPKGNMMAFTVLCNLTSELAQKLNLFQIFSSINKGLKRLLNCKEASIYLTSETMNEAYFEYHTNTHRIHKLLIDSNWYYMHTGGDYDLGEPIFAKPETISELVIEKDYILYPMYLESEKIFIIQCRHPEKRFSYNEKLLINAFMSSIRQALNYYFLLKVRNRLQEQFATLSKLNCDLSVSRNHQDLTNAVYSLLPGFSGFEGACVLYVDEEADEFYANTFSSTEETRFGEHIVRYPVNTGVCGKVLVSKSYMVFEDISRESEYNHLVDNLAGVKEPKSCLMVCLPGSRESVVGILELINKKTGKVSVEDVELIETVKVILGSYITHINENTEAIDLTIKLKKSIEMICRIIEQNFDVAVDISRVRETLNLIEKTTDLWIFEKERQISS